MARQVFNWSMLTREMLFNMLNVIQGEIVGKKLTVNEFHARISKHIKQHLPVRTIMDRDVETLSGYVYVGGYYYSHLDRKKNKPIAVLFSYHLFDEHVKITRYKWLRICSLFADTLLHEIIHMRQFRARNFKDIPGYQSTAERAKQRKDQSYFGDKDELGAYAFNIACELYDRFGTDFDAAKKYLDSNQVKRHKRTSLYRYMKVFDWNHSHPVIKSLKSKITRNLPYAQIGKPFRTTNYLTF